MMDAERLISLVNCIRCCNSLLNIAVSYHNTNHVQVTILILKKGSQVLSLMIWAKDKDDPFHWPSNPVAVNLLDIVLLDG